MSEEHREENMSRILKLAQKFNCFYLSGEFNTFTISSNQFSIASHSKIFQNPTINITVIILILAYTHDTIEKISVDAIIFLFRIDNGGLPPICGRGIPSWTCPSRSNETTAQISGSNHRKPC